MDKNIILAQAQSILDKLHDNPDSIRFHFKAVKLLGISKCFELASLTILKQRDGQITSSLGRYYNGCVMKEINKKKI